MTYQNILGKGLARYDIVESGYCKTLIPLKGMPTL